MAKYTLVNELYNIPIGTEFELRHLHDVLDKLGYKAYVYEFIGKKGILVGGELPIDKVENNANFKKVQTDKTSIF